MIQEDITAALAHLEQIALAIDGIYGDLPLRDSGLDDFFDKDYLMVQTPMSDGYELCKLISRDLRGVLVEDGDERTWFIPWGQLKAYREKGK